MLHCRNILTTSALIGLVLSTHVARADYQNEVGLYTFQSETSDNDKADGTTLYYQYFFNRVDTSKGPWAEAAFLNRAGNIGVFASKNSNDFGTGNAESSGTIVRGDIASPDSDFVFSAAYISSKTDYKSKSYSTENTGYSLGVGYFIQQNTLVTFDHTESETSYSGLSKSNDYDSKTNDIGIKTVMPLSMATALVLNASYSVRKDSNDSESKFTLLMATYYLNPRLGIGGYLADYSYNNPSLSSGGKSSAIYVNYFITRNAQLGLLYSQYKADNDSSTDSDLVQTTASVYF